MRFHFSGCDYTLGPPLRIPNIKNMGRDLAPKRLRICPGLMERRRPEEILAVLCPKPTLKSEIPEKFGRCAPKDTQVDHKNRDFLLESRENEDHAKMMHSISDLLSRYRLCYDPKNMPMSRPGGLRMWAEAKILYS